MKPLDILMHVNKNYCSKTPSLGSRPNGQMFSSEIDKVYKNTYPYREGIYKRLSSIPTSREILSLGGGDPLKSRPFPGTKKYINKLFKQNTLSAYNHSGGNKEHKEKLVEYFKKIGISRYKNNDDDYIPLSINNLIFTSSTSHAFSLILRTIARPHDVVLMTGPAYGLFSYYPERIGAETRFINLKKENGFILDPIELEQKIKEINKELSDNYCEKLSYIPRVVAFLNENPHNPTGIVLSEDNIDVLKNLTYVCEKNGVFIIDDLVYSGIEYNKNKPAYPLALISEHFNSVITMIGLSKSYSLAGLRAGLILANDFIISKIRDLIFQDMDSLSLLQSGILTYCLTHNSTSKATRYFNKIIQKYKINLEIIKLYINGDKKTLLTDRLSKVALKKIRKTLCEKDVQLFLNTSLKLQFAGDIMPQSGFFALIDFSSLKGKTFNNFVINTEEDLLYYIFEHTAVKFITGQSMAWPYADELIARITFSCDSSDLIKRLFLIKSLFIKLP